MMNVPGILICLLSLFYTLGAQGQHRTLQNLQDTVPLQVKDSTIIQKSDSVSVATEADGKMLARQDSSRTIASKSLVEITSDKFFAPSYMFSPSPRKAVLYSAIFPGLGQLYNRKYWKLPIVYGAFAGLTYAITWNNGYYQDYLQAYKDIMDDNPQTDSWEDMLPYGQDAESVDTEWFTGVLRQRKDYYRRYRDLSIIATVGVYLVFIVDAYVDAQLFNFDMGQDLSMRVAPVLMGGEKGLLQGRTSYGLQFNFQF